MVDYYEIDFLKLESKSSGDAIPIRYSINGVTRIHVTDGGFQSSGDSLVSHIKTYYDSPKIIHAVVVTHPDGDHAGGLRSLFGEFEIKELWMLRPWIYAEYLINRFSRFTNAENLAKRLREIYPNIAALEELAIENGVPIKAPFQGEIIGNFHVLAPSESQYFDLIVDSDKSPEAAKDESVALAEEIIKIFERAKNLIKAAWGEEYFPSNDTSPENNMSVIQYAHICDSHILLTGDAGRKALNEAADYAPSVGLSLPCKINTFQVPHHGSRHNIDVETLNKWLGTKNDAQSNPSQFTAVVSAAKEDKDHPRKSVIRAFVHRGAGVITTEDASQQVCSKHAPQRAGWSSSMPLQYPTEQEQ